MVQACAHTASINIFVWTAKGLDYVSTERSARYVAIAMVLESVSMGGVNIYVPKAVAREGACTESGKRYVPNVEEVVCAFIRKEKKAAASVILQHIACTERINVVALIATEREFACTRR